jgi:hypothetical protein
MIYERGLIKGMIWKMTCYDVFIEDITDLYQNVQSFIYNHWLKYSFSGTRFM